MKNRWIELGPYQPPLEGCSTQNLEELMIAQKVEKLPELYKEFMLVFGKISGGLRHEGEFIYPSVLNFKSKAKQFPIPEDSFVFLMGSDLLLLYFRTTQLMDNPMIYTVVENNSSIDQISLVSKEYSKLSDFLVGWVEDEIEVYQTQK